MLNIQELQRKKDESNLSYQQLARLLNLRSKTTAHNWIHGRSEIKASDLERLARIFKSDVQEFFTDGGEE